MDKFLTVQTENVGPNVTESSFWNGVNVWVRSPHVENRRLCGVKIKICGYILEPKIDDLSIIIERLLKIPRVEKYCNHDTLKQLIEKLGIKLSTQIIADVPNDQNVLLKIRELIPKNTTHFQPCYEAVLLDGINLQAVFIHLGPFKDSLSPRTPYSCNFKRQSADSSLIEFKLWNNCNQEDGSDSWLKTKLFPRLYKWIAVEHKPSSALPNSSLNIINVNAYNDKYQELKLKYAAKMVEIWPEQTDPLKFVYEDLAIASYLLCLWEDNEKKCSFIDLGCGNGLLVHILANEGHPGLGLDIRSRKLWSLYPPTTRLQVSCVTPSTETVYPDYDWIIGNHSDELTPWIPVMTAMSSPNSKFFLLPCCAYDFWGKYQRTNANNSQYTEYIKFIQDIGETCGFYVEIDKLRIPSTKRTCLIGRKKIKNVDKTFIWEYVNSRKQVNQDNFIPRPVEEPVRNCTKIASEVTNKVLEIIVGEILKEYKKQEGDEWYEGNHVLLCDAIKLLSTDLRNAMKKECGGLQTLLRNHHHLFIVQGGGVKFRKPTPRKPQDLSRWKIRPCWFYQNHPQGCPLPEDSCSFDHIL